MAADITKHHFKFGTLKYFRGNAHNIRICSFGQKRDPIGPKAHLDVEGTVKSKHVDSRIKYNGVTDVAWDKTTRAEAEINGVIKFFGLGRKGALTGSYKDAKKAKLKLVNFAVDEGPLKRMLNNDADIARRALADEGKDGRICSEVWVAMEAELAEHFSAYGSGSAGVKAAGSSLEFTASGGRHGSQTISLSEGTTFAYKLHKVTDWSKGKEKIEDMKADFKGMG